MMQIKLIKIAVSHQREERDKKKKRGLLKRHLSPHIRDPLKLLIASDRIRLALHWLAEARMRDWQEGEREMGYQ